MADYTLTMADGDYSVSAIDGNTKVALDGADLKVAPDGDVFGSALDGNWTELAGNAIYNGWAGKGTAAFGEAAGLLSCADGGNGGWCIGERRDVSYKDADLTIDWSNADSATQVAALIFLALWKQLDTLVYIFYNAKAPLGTNTISVVKIINGAVTALATSASVGIQASIKFRIKRVAATNTFTFYYDIGGGWVQLWTGIITDATHFPANCDLYPIPLVLDTNGNGRTFTPQLTSYAQKTDDGIAAQRFWDDSPEATLIESGQTYAYDAGASKVWELTGTSDSTSEPGTSTIKYKVGYSDDGLEGSVTWVDAAWKTIAEVNTNAANGDYDDHRYLHVKAQFNSDGTDQPTLTSFTLSGAAVNPATWAQDNAQAKEGTYSFKLVAGAASTSDYYAQSISVVEGEEYHIECFVYCTAYTSGTLYLEAYDITGSASIETADLESTTAGWRKLSFYFTAPASCTEVEIRIGCTTLVSSTVYFDCADCIRLRAKDYT